MGSSLSSVDIKRLPKDSSKENRQAAMRGMAMEFNEETLSDSERGTARDIFWVMAKDASDSVALPIIQFSEVLSKKINRNRAHAKW